MEHITEIRILRIKYPNMKNTLLLTGLFIIAAVSFSFIRKDTNLTVPAVKTSLISLSASIPVKGKADHKAAVATLSPDLYRELNLSEKGLSLKAFNTALQGYLHLQEQGILGNADLLSIIDFSQSSRKKRFYLINVKTKKLLVNTYVAHGKNSGVDMAKSFSNVVGSEKSSLGFYVTKETYTGKNGFSLRMNGVDEGFNDNAEERAIVVHGADYVNANRVNAPYMGRSQGCPALPREDYIKVIDMIKGGSALFIYSGSEDYLKNSEIVHS